MHSDSYENLKLLLESEFTFITFDLHCVHVRLVMERLSDLENISANEKGKTAMNPYEF
jgi:hypothetical protein